MSIILNHVVVGKSPSGPKGIATHHRDYYRFLKNIYPGAEYITGKRQILAFFSLKRLVLLDFEGDSFKYLPFLILRSLVGLKTDVYTVALVLLKREPADSYLKRKKFIFRVLKHLPTCCIYHTENDQGLVSYYNKVYKDFQYWDLPFLRSDTKYDEFGIKVKDIDPLNTLVFIGRFDAYRGASFVRELLAEYKHLPFKLLIWSDTVDQEIVNLSKERVEITVINQMPSGDDIINVHLHFKNILLYYPSLNRTSGFIGRGLQSGNYLFVSGKVKIDFFGEYDRIIGIETPNELVDKFVLMQTKPFSQNLICIHPYLIETEAYQRDAETIKSFN